MGKEAPLTPSAEIDPATVAPTFERAKDFLNLRVPRWRRRAGLTRPPLSITDWRLSITAA